MDLHIEEKAAELRETGLCEEDARVAARRHFGNIPVTQEECRDIWISRFWAEFWQDLRYGARNLMRSKAITVAALLTLVLGIGVNTSIFTVLYSVILRPVPVRSPNDVIRIHQAFRGEFERGVNGNVALLSYPEYLNYRDHNQTLSGLAAYTGVDVKLAGSQRQRIRALLISCNYFSTLTVKMHLGRSTVPEECETSGSSPVAVLTYRFWTKNLASDGDVVGRTILLNDARFEVIGIAEEGFAGVEVDTPDVFIPITMVSVVTNGRGDLSSPNVSWLTVVGRSKAGVSIALARSDLSQISRQMDRNYPGRITTLSVTRASLLGGPGAEAKAGIASVAALAIGGVLLLLVCANVANLLFARADRRRQEIGMRLALGAPRSRIVRQLLTEAVLLGILGGGASLALACVLPGMILRFGSGEDLRIDTSLNWAIFSYAFGVSAITGIVFGLLPARQAVKVEVLPFIKGDGAPSHAGVSGLRFRKALVALQLMVSLSAIATATLLTRGIHLAQDTDLGFVVADVLVLTLDESKNARDVEARVRAIPGVQATAWTTAPPMSSLRTTVPISADSTEHPLSPIEVRQSVVSEDYFETMGISFLAGGTFPTARRTPGLSPAVITQAMARRFWQGASPLGRTFRSGEMQYFVEGIVKDIRSVEFSTDDGPLFYTLFDPFSAEGGVLLVRMPSETVGVSTVTMAARSAAPGVEIAGERMADYLKRDLRSSEAGATLAVILAGLALLLAVVGVYGVVTFAVAQQTREIGIRTTLGATQSQVLTWIIRQWMKPVLIGSVGGLAAAVGISMLIHSLLYGLNPLDPVSYLGAVVFQLTVALVAICIPAQRAVRVDPTVAIRGY